VKEKKSLLERLGLVETVKMDTETDTTKSFLDDEYMDEVFKSDYNKIEKEELLENTQNDAEEEYIEESQQNSNDGSLFEQSFEMDKQQNDEVDPTENESFFDESDVFNEELEIKELEKEEVEETEEVKEFEEEEVKDSIDDKEIEIEEPIVDEVTEKLFNTEESLEEVNENDVNIFENNLSSEEENPLDGNSFDEVIGEEQDNTMGELINEQEKGVIKETKEAPTSLFEVEEDDVVDEALEFESENLFDEETNFSEKTSEKNVFLTVKNVYEKEALIYSKKQSIFMIDAYLNALPKNLPYEIKRQSVVEILKASDLNINELVADGHRRLKALNEELEGRTSETDGIVSENEAKIYDLEVQIENIKEEIRERKHKQRTQKEEYEYETQKIEDILKFIHPEE